jgi:hypothetical protein
MSIWMLKVAGALTHDGSWSSIFLEGKDYACSQTVTHPATNLLKNVELSHMKQICKGV